MSWAAAIADPHQRLVQSGAALACGTHDHSPWASTIVGGTPQQFDAFIESELKRWPEVVEAAGIKPE